MGALNDARSVIVLQAGDPGYEFARAVYLVDAADPALAPRAYRLCQDGSGPCWRVREVADPAGARLAYYVDVTGAPV